MSSIFLLKKIKKGTITHHFVSLAKLLSNRNDWRILLMRHAKHFSILSSFETFSFISGYFHMNLTPQKPGWGSVNGETLGLRLLFQLPIYTPDLSFPELLSFPHLILVFISIPCLLSKVDTLSVSCE